MGYQMRVRTNSEDIGRCGCGRREYCDGSHGLTETQWQEVRAKELEAPGENTNIANIANTTKIENITQQKKKASGLFTALLWRISDLPGGSADSDPGTCAK
ncbi:MAG: hypothetical protein ACOH2B_14755 [Burkholderiaceae bacterium]